MIPSILDGYADNVQRNLNVQSRMNATKKVVEAFQALNMPTPPIGFN